jgi:tetratricopeptide (TPR) repeat protein
VTSGGGLPSAQKNLLWVSSGNRCAYPGCLETLVRVVGGKLVTVGEIAHICAQSPKGPRSDASLTRDYIDSAANCLILCPPHHKAADRGEPLPSVEVMHEWKSRHEARHASGLHSVHNVTVPPTVGHYVDRPDELLQIDQHLKVSRKVVVAGVSGDGKSQLAAAYASSREASYEHVWWLPAGSEEVLAASISRIASLLGLADTGSAEDERVRHVLRYLTATNEPSLIVFDGAAPNVVAGFLPELTGIDVVITSQDQAWPGLPVTVLRSVEASVARQILRRLMAATQEDKEAEDRLIDLCAGSPLALTQVASYQVQTGMPAARLAELLASRRIEVLARGRAPEAVSVVAALRLSRASLSRKSQMLLDCMAALGPAPIEVLPIAGPGGDWPFPGDDLEMEDAIGELRRFSLIARSDRRLQVHDLVRALTYEELDPQRRNLAIVLATGVLNNVTPEDPSRDDQLEQFAQIMPHATSLLLRLADEFPRGTAFYAHLANKVGLYLQARGDDHGAERTFRGAVDMVEADPDTSLDKSILGSLYNNIGTVLQEMGEPGGAREAFDVALSYKVERDPSSVATAITLSSTAVSEFRAGNLEAALNLYGDALSIYRANDDVPRAADALQDIAEVRQRLGQPDEALALLRESQQLAASTHEAWPEHCAALMAEADFHRGQDRADEALRCSDAAVSLARRPAGGRKLASALTQRSHLRGEGGDLAGAIADGREALAQIEMVEPLGGIATERIRGDLGMVLLHAGQLQEAVDCLLQSDAALEQRLPAGHYSLNVSRWLLQQAFLAAAGEPELQRRVLEYLIAHGPLILGPGLPLADPSARSRGGRAPGWGGEAIP